jgi:hypothetical protein
MINKKDCETFCGMVDERISKRWAAGVSRPETHDGLRLKVVDLRQHGSETRETETQE